MPVFETWYRPTSENDSKSTSRKATSGQPNATASAQSTRGHRHLRGKLHVSVSGSPANNPASAPLQIRKNGGRNGRRVAATNSNGNQYANNRIVKTVGRGRRRLPIAAAIAASAVRIGRYA